MANQRNAKNLSGRLSFKRVSLSLTLLPLLASTSIAPAAFANEPGGRGAAFKAFQLENQGLDRKELHQLFKQAWSGQNGAGNATESVIQAQSNLSNTNHQRLNKIDFASNAEFQAAKQALRNEARDLSNTVNQTLQQTAGNKMVNTNQGLALDLGSAVESITLGNKLFKNQESVTINVGGQDKTFSAGSKVTAAEYIAAKQAIGGGQQTVTLDASGRAVGGEVDLSAMTSGNKTMKITDLNVPVSVIATGDFGKGGDVKITGDLSNSGSINALASGNKQVNALIKADNITNNVGATINSTVSDLTLQADDSFSNYGDISATGNLTISAGETLTNSGNISAQKNLNVLAPNVINSGMLASAQANLNLDTPVSAEMNVNNANGAFQALNGSINIRSAAYDAPFNTTITGGDLLSKEVNAYTGGGTTNVFVKDLTGIINTSGTAAHVSADTSDLIIGNQCLVGDPTYYNTGNIIIGGNIIVGETLAIIAGGNITTNQTSLTIRARDVSNNGCDINIIAGANVVAGSGEVSPPGGPATLPTQSVGTITENTTSGVSFTGASTTGGVIDFSNVTGFSIIDASAAGAGSNGGNVTLAAFAGTASSANGWIFLGNDNNWTINTGGQGAGNNGSINVIAGAASSTGITLGTLINNGGATNAAINIITAQPTLSSGTSINFNTAGAITTGNTIVAATDRTAASIFVFGDIFSQGDVTVHTAGEVSAQNIVSPESHISIVTDVNRDTTIFGQINGHDVSITTFDLLFTTAQNITAAALADGTGGSITLNVDNVASNAGPGPFTLNAVGTGTGDGGSISFTSNSLDAVTVGSAGQYVFNVAGGTGEASELALEFAGDVVLNAGGINGSSTNGGVLTVVSSNNNLTVNSNAIAVGAGVGNGAAIGLIAGVDGTGLLTINDASFASQANGAGPNGNGGELLFAGQDIILPANSAADPLELTATGSGTGNGGFISFLTGSSRAIVLGPLVGKAPKGPTTFLTVNASSGVAGGNGGAIDIETGGSLTVNMNGTTANPQELTGTWNGASYIFAAGLNPPGAALIINGNINASGVNGGTGGFITLVSANKTAFAINPTSLPKNGIFGTLTADGTDGEIYIENGLSGISIPRPNSISAPTITMVANAKGSITTGAGVVITAPDELNLVAQTGSIGGKVPIVVDTADLLVLTNGLASITNISTGPLNLADSFGGKGFTLRASGPVTLNDIGTTKGSILIVSSSGAMTVEAGSQITAIGGALTLQNTDTASGTIVIGDDAEVQTGGKGKQVSLVIGASIPKVGTNPFPPGSAPAGIDAQNLGKGIIFFGTPGLVLSTATMPIENAEVIAKGVNVLFSGTAPNSIVLGKSSLVMGDPPIKEATAVSINSVSAAIPSALQSALPVESKPTNTEIMFGFHSENATFTSDLSVSNINSTRQPTSATNPTLMTASNASMIAASRNIDEDNSYAVGYCNATGSVDGAICSDNEIIAGQIAGAAKVPTVQHDERISFKEGTVLLVPFRDTVVETPNGTVHVSARSLALISNTVAGLAVYDLDDQHKGSVKVESNGHSLVLSPGRHVTISPQHHAEFAQVNTLESISHRSVQSVVKNGHAAHTSEFSVLSAMDCVKPLKAMIASSHPHAKNIAERMMKTTAIILHLSATTATGGQYQHYFKPRLSAKL